MNRKLIITFTAGMLLMFLVWSCSKQDSAAGAGSPVATVDIKDTRATLATKTGSLRVGNNQGSLEFRDASGSLVDVGSVKLNLSMNMPGMVMRSDAKIARTGTAGIYSVDLKPEMAGGWRAELAIDGPKGAARSSFNINVHQ